MRKRQLKPSRAATDNTVEEENDMTERHMLDIVHHQNPVTLAATATAQEACSLKHHQHIYITVFPIR